MQLFYKMCLSVSVFLVLTPALHPVAEHKDFVTLTQIDQKLTITTLYGSCTLDRLEEPIFFDLLESPAMERLKKINQLGIYDKYSHHANFNRFDHSVGVWFLIRKAGGSITEQVAGLLHDVSHTAFSHVGAYCFVTDYKQMDAYQDDEHEQYLYDSGIVDILAKHGFAVEDIHHKKSSFTILEANLPDLCADRIEYNLQGGVKEEIITPEQARFISDRLTYDEGIWYCTDLAAARMLAHCSLIMTRTIWGSPENDLTGKLLGQALRKGISLHLFTRDTIRFSTDDDIWQRMQASQDREILSCLYTIEHIQNFFTLNNHTFDTVIPAKFRGVNPYVQTPHHQLQRLTDLDANYAREYKKIQSLLTHGWHVLYTCGWAV